MSTPRVRFLNQKIWISQTTWDAETETLTVECQVPHNLYTGALAIVTSTLTLDHYNTPKPVTVISPTVFTVSFPGTEYTHFQYDVHPYVVVNGFLPGQTGGIGQYTLPRQTGNAAIVQSYVTGTGGASYAIEVSLDGIHWISAATITHTTTTDDTGFVTIEPGWAYIRPNITSIGTNTTLSIITGQ